MNERGKIRRFKAQLIKISEAFNCPGLHISEHVAERIFERHMARDIPFIAAIAKNFYENVFTQTTYCERSYKVGFRGLFVCFRVTVGAVSGERRAVLTTTYEGEQDYFTDETIILK